MMKNSSISRRNFITKTTLSAAGAALGIQTIASPFTGKILNANEKIRVGFIGVGNRGSQLLEAFMNSPDVEIAAFCDLYEPYLLRDRSKVHQRYLDAGRVPKMGEVFNSDVKKYSDFRKLLEDNDIDAVCIATPDHWHAIQTIMALDAGKHVYVEKPLSMTIKEGRKMVDAQKKSGKVCAVGLNRRGCTIYQHLVKEVQGGKIGNVTTARAQRTSNMYPDGIGKLQPEDPPENFNWDMWLGPRAFRAYQYNIAPYRFRWWKDYSSQMGNWGVHYMDTIRWLMGEEAPIAITAVGGKYTLDDDRTIPDTMEVLFEMPSGSIIQFGIHEANSGGRIPDAEVALHGTKGNLMASMDDYRIEPARSGQFQEWEQLIEPEKKSLEDSAEFGKMGIEEDTTAILVRNFLNCIKSGEEPLCPLEEGHRSTSFALLANIALETGDRLEWDPENERFTNNAEANNYLHYEYRDPWTL